MTDIPLVDLDVHHKPRDFADHIALGFTKALRWSADTFFAKRYGHRAIVLETVAAVPGMVGATINHGFASELAGLAPAVAAAPYPAHADDIRMAA